MYQISWVIFGIQVLLNHHILPFPPTDNPAPNSSCPMGPWELSWSSLVYSFSWHDNWEIIVPLLEIPYASFIPVSSKIWQCFIVVNLNYFLPKRWIKGRNITLLIFVFLAPSTVLNIKLNTKPCLLWLYHSSYIWAVAYVTLWVMTVENTWKAVRLATFV